MRRFTCAAPNNIITKLVLMILRHVFLAIAAPGIRIQILFPRFYECCHLRIVPFVEHVARNGRPPAEIVTTGNAIATIQIGTVVPQN